MNHHDRRPLSEEKAHADAVEHFASITAPPAPAGPPRSPHIEAGWAEHIRTYRHLTGAR